MEQRPNRKKSIMGDNFSESQSLCKPAVPNGPFEIVLQVQFCTTKNAFISSIVVDSKFLATYRFGFFSCTNSDWRLAFCTCIRHRSSVQKRFKISHGPLSCCKESGRFCGPVVRVGVNLASVDEYDEQSRLQVGGLLIVFRINFKFSSTRITSNYFR